MTGNGTGFGFSFVTNARNGETFLTGQTAMAFPAEATRLTGGSFAFLKGVLVATGFAALAGIRTCGASFAGMARRPETDLARRIALVAGVLTAGFLESLTDLAAIFR
jgi:hypothetical protein